VDDDLGEEALVFAASLLIAQRILGRRRGLRAKSGASGGWTGVLAPDSSRARASSSWSSRARWSTVS
jgi:hypothetical protein